MIKTIEYVTNLQSLNIRYSKSRYSKSISLQLSLLQNFMVPICCVL